MIVKRHSVVQFLNQDCDLFDATGKIVLSADIFFSNDVAEIYCEEFVDPEILVNIMLSNKHFRKMTAVDREIRLFMSDGDEVSRVTLVAYGDTTGRELMGTFDGKTDHIAPCSGQEMVKCVRAITHEEIPHPEVIRKKLEKRIGLKYVKTIDVL